MRGIEPPFTRSPQHLFFLLLKLTVVGVLLVALLPPCGFVFTHCHQKGQAHTCKIKKTTDKNTNRGQCPSRQILHLDF